MVSWSRVKKINIINAFIIFVFEWYKSMFVICHSIAVIIITILPSSFHNYANKIASRKNRRNQRGQSFQRIYLTANVETNEKPIPVGHLHALSKSVKFLEH